MARKVAEGQVWCDASGELLLIRGLDLNLAFYEDLYGDDGQLYKDSVPALFSYVGEL